MTACAPHDEGHICRRCGQVTRPRGQVLPRFCAVCGNPFDHVGPVQHRFAPPYRPGGLGALALALGLAALFIPAAGMLMGVLAVVLAHSVRQSPQRAGRGLATLGAVLGVIAAIVHTGVCWAVQC